MTVDPGRAIEVRVALVLLRHGQSVANEEDRFGGWLDEPLTHGGRRRAAVAALALAATGAQPDVVYTSSLARATETAEIILDVLGLRDVPVERSWRLNERHYGRLQGRRRDDVRADFGTDRVERWRRTYDGRPPGGESIADVTDRVTPYWRERICPDVSRGRRCLVVSHGNTLRALVHLIEGLGPEQVTSVDVPTGIPRVYLTGVACEPVTAGDPSPETVTRGACRDDVAQPWDWSGCAAWPPRIGIHDGAGHPRPA